MILRLLAPGPSLRSTWSRDLPCDTLIAVNAAADMVDAEPDIVCCGDWTTLRDLRHRPRLMLWTPWILDGFIDDGRCPGPHPPIVHWPGHLLPLQPTETNYSTIAALALVARIFAHARREVTLHLHGVDCHGTVDAAGLDHPTSRTPTRWATETAHLDEQLARAYAAGITWTRHP